MNNLRIVYDNAANRATSLVASSTAGSLVVANLLNDLKGQVWRSTSTSATLTITWANAEFVGCVALPYANFTSTTTIRVRGYSEPGDSSAFFDTGTVLACPYQSLDTVGWGTMPLGTNAYTGSGISYGNIWFAKSSIKKLVIDLVDTSNSFGYLQAGRLVIGNYWSPSVNADLGAQITMVDASVNRRTDGGDLITDGGTRSRKITLNVSYMSDFDRLHMIYIIRNNGLPVPLYFSLFPESTNASMEQTYQIYCKQSTVTNLAISQFGAYSAPIELEEI